MIEREVRHFSSGAASEKRHGHHEGCSSFGTPTAALDICGVLIKMPRSTQERCSLGDRLCGALIRRRHGSANVATC